MMSTTNSSRPPAKAVPIIPSFRFLEQQHRGGIECYSMTAGCMHADPVLAYGAGAEVNQLQWSTAQPDWVAICFANNTQILRV